MKCQHCGNDVDKFDAMLDCAACGTMLDPQMQRQLRESKRFELVKAMVGGDAARDPDVPWSPVGVVSARADAILAALYGPEPGKDES